MTAATIDLRDELPFWSALPAALASAIGSAGEVRRVEARRVVVEWPGWTLTVGPDRGDRRGRAMLWPAYRERDGMTRYAFEWLARRGGVRIECGFSTRREPEAVAREIARLIASTAAVRGELDRQVEAAQSSRDRSVGAVARLAELIGVEPYAAHDDRGDRLHAAAHHDAAWLEVRGIPGDALDVEVRLRCRADVAERVVREVVRAVAQDGGR